MARPGGKPEGYSTAVGVTTDAFSPQLGSHTRNTRGRRGRGMNFKLLADILHEEAALPDGFDLASTIVELLKDPVRLDAKTKLAASLELLQYIEPKKKAIEHHGKVELDDESLRERLQYLLSKARGESGDQSGQPDAGREAGALGALEPGGQQEEA